MKIYLATSWRNAYHADVLAQLRGRGAEVYDFKNPALENYGFSWEKCDSNFHRTPPRDRQALTVPQMRQLLMHPAAQEGFDFDFEAMQWADSCVLLLPSGMSAHLEAGWFAGAGKRVAVLAPEEIREPELMYKMFDFKQFDDDSGWGWRTPLFRTVDEVFAFLGF